MAMAGLTYRSGVFLVLLAGSIWSTTGLMIRLIEEAQTWQILFGLAHPDMSETEGPEMAKKH